jgi:hypothetical protein
MIGFYSIRKLIEAHKISDELRDRPVPLRVYPWTGRDVTYMNWDKIDLNYDLESPVSLQQSVAWIANQLVHSFVFMANCNERGGLESILFNSDHTSRKHLYEVAIDQLIGTYQESCPLGVLELRTSMHLTSICALGSSWSWNLRHLIVVYSGG